MKLFKKKIKIYYLMIPFVFLIGITIVYGTELLNTWSGGFRVDHQTTKDVKVTSAQTCHRVVNSNASNDYFVPTQTLSEWDSFSNYAPSGISIESCCISHNSYSCSDGNIYWYNSCGQRESVKENCSCGCSGSSCISPVSYCSIYSAYSYYGDCCSFTCYAYTAPYCKTALIYGPLDEGCKNVFCRDCTFWATKCP